MTFGDWKTVPQRKRARRLKPDARWSVVAERATLHPPQRMPGEEAIQVHTLLYEKFQRFRRNQNFAPLMAMPD